MRAKTRYGGLGLGLVLVNGLATAAISAQAAAVDPHVIATRGLPPTVPACQTCHGALGEGNKAASFPRLAGLGQSYLAAQLTAFASASRANPVMQPIAAGLSLAQRTAMAAYYARLGGPQPLSAGAAADPQPTQTGPWLAARGRWSADIPACSQCHGTQGLGVGDSFPPLAGQPAAYIAAQLQSWKHGTRPPGPQSLMLKIAARLSDDDVAAVADYYASLPASGAAVALPRSAKP